MNRRDSSHQRAHRVRLVRIAPVPKNRFRLCQPIRVVLEQRRVGHLLRAARVFEVVDARRASDDSVEDRLPRSRDDAGAEVAAELQGGLKDAGERQHEEQRQQEDLHTRGFYCQVWRP